MISTLEDISQEFQDATRQERIELLIDFARSLPPLPDHLEALKDPDHKVHECQSPVYLFVEVDPARRVHIQADVPLEAPTVRGFVAILVSAFEGQPVDEILALGSQDVINRLGLLDVLGMQRQNGLVGVMNSVKARVARASAG